MPVFDVDQWINDVVKGRFNIPDSDIPHKEIKEGFMRQDEFSRRSQRLDQEHKDRMAREDKFHDDLSVAEDKLKLVADLESKFGPATNWSTALATAISAQHPELSQSTPGNNFSLDQVQQIVQRAIAPLQQQIAETQQYAANVGIGAATMIDFMPHALEHWRTTYGKPFPKDEFNKYFNDPNFKVKDPFLALQLFEAPHKEEKAKAQYAADLAAAKQEGYQSAMTKNGLHEPPPVATGMFFSGTDAPRVDPTTGQAVTPPQAEPSHDERRAKVGKSFFDAINAANSGKIPGVTPGA
jgi:hypothetical protein